MLVLTQAVLRYLSRVETPLDLVIRQDKLEAVAPRLSVQVERRTATARFGRHVMLDGHAVDVDAYVAAEIGPLLVALGVSPPRAS